MDGCLSRWHTNPQEGLASATFYASRFTPTSRRMSDLPSLPVEPRPGRYRHYKGNDYCVEGMVRHSETLEVLVLYRALYGDTTALWVRPHAMFMETVVVDGRIQPRFARVDDK